MAEELLELGKPPKKGPKISLKAARGKAARLLRYLGPWIAFGEVAGSVRRQKPQIGDVEVVVLPTSLPALLWHLEAAGFHGGDRIQRKMERGTKLEVYIAHKPQELGAMMLTLTGDYQMNIALRQIAKRHGWLLNQYGLWDAETREPILQSPYEEDFFGALGVDYHAPQERSLADRPASRKANLGARLPAPERRRVGPLQLELWYDPNDDEWILWVGRLLKSGEPWFDEFHFADEPTARTWFTSVQSDADLEELLRLRDQDDAA